MYMYMYVYILLLALKIFLYYFFNNLFSMYSLLQNLLGNSEHSGFILFVSLFHVFCFFVPTVLCSKRVPWFYFTILLLNYIFCI